MKHSIRKEMKTAMDPIAFSQESKDALVQKLLEVNPQPAHRFHSRRLVCLAAAAVMLVAMLTGAAVFTRWSDNLNAQYNADEDQRQYAQSIDLSSEAHEIASASDQGITVTAIQTIVDAYRAKLVFRIDGLTLAEGESPDLEGGVYSIGGLTEGVWDMQTGGFFTGTKIGPKGTTVYTDGTPVQTDEAGNLIFRYADSNGSLEYEIDLHFAQPGSHLGKEITVHFSGFGTSDGCAGSNLRVAGDWTLSWTLEGTDKTILSMPDMPIGDTGHHVKETEVTPLTLRAVIRTADYFSGWETLEYFSPSLAGVQLRDGSIHLCTMPSSEGYLDAEKLLYEMEVRSDEILDVDQITGLVFLESGEEPAQYIIPIT